ncbi:hypothetical protein BJY24_007544 [Nocardia transvalensis]|uniref:Uncharacterized protein n=1 Tax=Nocardia transvalensis TaxID=37333 RepID=A0A7W9UMR2_9NOCA|nr:hypothetical protein [Nocardia transvalensis]MBB5918632.1 hypothetical protein [Nocardia transvalensis]
MVLRAARYAITDLLEDLVGGIEADERLLVAAELWKRTADLLLTGHGRWSAGGKRLQRELVDYDRERGTGYARTLADSVRAVTGGATGPMIAVVTGVLEMFGGRLFEGYRVTGPPPDVGGRGRLQSGG